MTHPVRNRRWPVRLLLFCLLTGALLLWSNRVLQVTFFDPAFKTLPPGFDGCRIAVLSDLHTASFGRENERLIEAVREQAPEYIFFTGDLIDAFREVPPDYAARTGAQLAGIAPTYYVTGNHEWAAGGVPALKEALTRSGVTVLSNQFLTLERNGDRVVLAGIDDPNGYADQKSPEALAAEVYAACGDPFWLLLAHRHDRFVRQYSLLGADLVLSGHGHGGVIRLPFTDGLLSTDRTFFPDHTAGLYEENGSVLFVSRGLGNTQHIPRLFNRPEIAILTLHSDAA